MGVSKKEYTDAAKLIQVRGFERKPRKAIDTANLEVREEHIYPEVENREDYTELEPEVTDTLVLVPAQIYVRRIIRHKMVLKSNLQIKDPERNASISDGIMLKIGPMIAISVVW